AARILLLLSRLRTSSDPPPTLYPGDRKTLAKRSMAALASGNGTIDAAATAEQRETAQSAPIRSATNPMVTPLLTDLYQFTMAYAYWKAGKHLERAVFDLYFRKNPFGGEYTVFAGLEECIRLIANFHFKEEDISFMRSVMPTCEDGFFEYLRELDCSDVEVYAVPEGSVVFPKVPLIRVEGPVAVVQLLETPFVNLVNYASLVTTNAARHRFVAGNTKNLLEFGLRRAQGPDGGISASKYCYIGGFDATSNVAAGNLFGIPLRGTHSHAFVSSYMSPDEIVDKSLHSHDGSSTCMDFLSLVQTWLSKLQFSESLHGVFGETNQSELAAFTSYALAFPNNFLALVDTYDVMRSGIPNFCAVALALNDLGYKASGIRLDSGDLAYLSIEARKFFQAIEKEFNVPGFGKMSITASNDLNEETLDALNKQGHEIDAFGIGTYLVTCYAQAALGCVFKLVEINKQPRIKLSEDVTKVSIPCKKQCFRLYGREGYALVDIMTGENETPPKVGERILCRHPFNESKRAYVVPQRVEELLKCYWPGSSNKPREDLPLLKNIRDRCMQQLEQMRSDHMRRLNPTPYKVSVSGKLYDFIHFLWLSEAPKQAVAADMPSHEMDAKTDSEVTSNATSSPARPVYYVQSPSRDSHDGEKTTTTTTSFNSSPALSPPRSHSSVGRHSRESSSSRFSGSLKPAGARKISPHDGGGRGRCRRGGKTWKECAVIEEEGLLDGEDDDAGVPRRCYFLGFVLAFFVLFSFFALILWGASRNQRPRIIMKSITFDNFIIQAGTDASLVPTDMATLNSTLKFTYRNTGSFFGVHVTSTPIDLNYYQLTLASGNMNDFYQSRKSKRDLRVVVKGHQVPLYGGGSSLSSSEGKTSGPVGMTLGFTVRSRAYVLGKLVKPKFYSNVQCSVTMDQTKLSTPVSLKNSCRYS
ncbi:unnamed protein product, partial [Musa acuminata var. zebrina]